MVRLNQDNKVACYKTKTVNWKRLKCSIKLRGTAMLGDNYLQDLSTGATPFTFQVFIWRIVDMKNINQCSFKFFCFSITQAFASLSSLLSSQWTGAFWLRVQLDFLVGWLRLRKVHRHDEMQCVPWWEALPSEQWLETQELRLRVARNGWECTGLQICTRANTK